MQYCTKCGTQLPEGARFCGRCGTRLTPTGPPVYPTPTVGRQCPDCSSTLPPGERWCPTCHSNVVDPMVGRLASPTKRFAAFLLDGIIPTAVFFILIFVLVGTGATETSDETTSTAGVAIAFLGALAYSVFALVLFARGTTPGKRLLNMYVVKEAGARAGFWTMLFREWIGKWVSSVVLGLGFFAILWDKNNQGWHDKLASTYVVTARSAA